MKNTYVGDDSPNTKSLADREAQLRTILDTSVEGIVTIDDRGLIETMNPGAERLFGYAEAEVVGQNVTLLMPSPYKDEHDGYLARYRETGEKRIIGIGRDVMGRRKNGETFPIHLGVSEVQLSTGRIFTGFIHDLSERVAAEVQLRNLAAELEQRVQERTRELNQVHEELIRKERLATLGQLAGGLAHEIRNPLGVIRNATYFLREMFDKGDEDVRDSFDEIERALASSNHIVAELLDYARDPQPKQIVFSAREATDHALAVLDLGHKVRLERPEAPELYCIGDQGQTERILINLISNGVQAMPGGGTLTLGCRAEADAVLFDVTDTGVGIPAEYLNKVFDPLFTRKAKGIGLGLAISRRYAELSHGAITVESTPGKGSTFRLTLPRARARMETTCERQYSDFGCGRRTRHAARLAAAAAAEGLRNRDG